MIRNASGEALVPQALVVRTVPGWASGDKVALITRVVGVMVAGIGAITSKMGEAIDTARTWQDWMGKDEAAIDGMKKAVDGIIPSLLLMKTRTQLTTGEFKASEAQLQAVAKAAVAYTRINKTEFQPTLEKLTKSIKMGSDTELRKLGINVELLGTKAQKTAKALEIIENKCEGMVPIRELLDDFYEHDEDNFCLTGRHTGKKYQLGDPVKVEIIRTNLPKRQLDLAIID